MDTTPDTNAEVDKKITEYYLNMVQYDKLTIENFDDEELREKYKTLNREEFKKISELLKENKLSNAYFHSLPVYKDNYEESYSLFKQILKLEREKERQEREGATE